MKATLSRRASAPVRNHKPRGKQSNFARAVNRIERVSGVPFEQFLYYATVNPVCASVHQESADCMVIRLVDILGKVLVTIPVKRAFYDAIHEAITKLGVPLHRFIMMAVESELARVKGGAR